MEALNFPKQFINIIKCMSRDLIIYFNVSKRKLPGIKIENGVSQDDLLLSYLYGLRMLPVMNTLVRRPRCKL